MFGIFLVPVSLGNLEHIAPLGGAVFRTSAAVLPAGGHRKGDHPVPKGKEKQAPGGIFCPVDGKGAVHGCRELSQQIHKVHPIIPASGYQKSRPPDDRQRQQPHPPWIFLCGYRIKNILPLKGVAYCIDEPLNANIIANCNFEFLNKYGYSMSNSFAVPVAVGYINNLLNSGVNKKQISSKLHSLQKYDVSDLYKKFLTNQNDSIPIVFLIDNSNILCQKYMDIFYHQYEVQATAISTIFDTEDIRIKKVKNLTNI